MSFLDDVDFPWEDYDIALGGNEPPDSTLTESQLLKSLKRKVMAETKKVPEAQAPAQPGTGVVDYMEQLRAMAIQTTEAEKPSSSWVSFKGGQLVINEQRMKGDKAPVVVIHSIFENQLYKNKYDPNNPEPPICYAFGETDEGLAPHPDSTSPQNVDCATCPKNEWGSDPAGGKGKACKNVRRLALMSSADLDKVDKANIVLAKLPVTSVKNWSTYANQVANVLKVPPIAVITELSVVPDSRTMLQVEFQLVDKITDMNVIGQLLKRKQETNALIYQPYDKLVEKAATPEQARKY